MTDHAASAPDDRRKEQPLTTSTEPDRQQQLVVDDLLLVLFDPASDTIRGENILFYVLAGGLLTDLSMAGAIEVADRGLRGRVVSAVEGKRPTEPILASAWDHIAEKPRDVQGILAKIGPPLRALVLDRLVAGGHLLREKRKLLGFIPADALTDGDMTRRAALIERMRAALVDGEVPDERIASLIALVSASRALPQFHREIPWGDDVATRAARYQRGDVEANASAAAVTRTFNAIIVSSIVNATVVAAATANR